MGFWVDYSTDMVLTPCISFLIFSKVFVPVWILKSLIFKGLRKGISKFDVWHSYLYFEAVDVLQNVKNLSNTGNAKFRSQRSGNTIIRSIGGCVYIWVQFLLNMKKCQTCDISAVFNLASLFFRRFHIPTVWWGSTKMVGILEWSLAEVKALTTGLIVFAANRFNRCSFGYQTNKLVKKRQHYADTPRNGTPFFSLFYPFFLVERGLNYLQTGYAKCCELCADIISPRFFRQILSFILNITISDGWVL